jgi:hypothetical protein
MKKKLRLIERDFISLLKKIVLEQTDDMDDNASLTQRDAEQQKLAQPAAQGQVACPGGYRQKEKGPYALYDQSTAIQNLQKQFNITQDGKLGPTTLRYIRHFFQNPKKTQITDDEINTFIKQSTPDAVGATNAQTQQPMQNNAGVVDLRGLDKLNFLNNAFRKKNEDGSYAILITRTEGDVILSTNCNLLNKNLVYNY